MIDQADFRTVLGQFCTGVTVITTVGPNGPVGFACQSFSALSLDPPLVLFCPGKTSRAWPVIEAAGRFAVNVLSEGQRGLSTVFGSRGEDKFAGVDWAPAPSGAPVLDGVLTWIDCSVERVCDGGDHHIVLGRVEKFGPIGTGRPLLFHRGRYTGVVPARDEIGPADQPLAAFLAWPAGDDWL